MADLKSTYMGIPLENPLVAGASSLTSHLDSIRKLEDAGAGALIISSLFEEQIQLQRYKMDEDLVMYDDWHAEMTDIFPEMDHAGPDEHLMWTQRGKEAVDIPVIASLNCINTETWVEWAKKLEQTGVDGLELNFFAIPVEFTQDAQAIEQHQIEVLREVATAVTIPVSVKLSPFYTSPLQLIKAMDDAGASGFILFNRFFHPSFDIEKETSSFPFNLSTQNDHRLPLRFVGLLAGNLQASICGSNGIHTGADAVEMLLAGADVFQTVSALYLNGTGRIGEMLRDIEEWMDRKGYRTLDDFRGKLSVERTPDRFTYRRAQYVRMLLKSDEYVQRPKLI